MKIFFPASVLCIYMLFSPLVFAIPLSFESALKLYDDKKYDESYQAFLSLVETDYSNVDYNYYLARSAFFVEEYNEAISAYERILILYPNNARSKLELGRLYYHIKRYPLAKAYLNDVLKSNAPMAVKNNIRYYLAKMESENQEVQHNTLKGTVLASLFNDSNLNYSPESDVLTLPAGNLTSPSDIGAWGTEQMLILNHRYDNPEKLGFAIKNDFAFYNKSVPGNSEFNVLYASYSPALSYQKQNWTMDAALSVDDMKFGKDPYLVSYGIAPKITYMPSLTQYISTQFKLLKRDYQTTANTAKNSKFSQLSSIYQQRLGPLFSWYGQGILEEEMKDQSTTKVVNVDYQLLGLKFGANYLLLKGMSLDVSAGAQFKYFTENDKLLSFFNAPTRKQNDQRYAVEVMLAKDFEKGITAQFKASRIQNNSNISVYAYDKNLFTVNLIKRF